jgi:hypothetical protein
MVERYCIFGASLAYIHNSYFQQLLFRLAFPHWGTYKKPTTLSSNQDMGR